MVPDNSIRTIAGRIGWTLSQLVLAATLAMLIGYFFRSSIHDYMQYDSDAFEFYTAASGASPDVGLDESLLIIENLLPIFAWGWMYDLADLLGFDTDPFWGILLNAALVISAEILTLIYARRTFGFDNRKLVLLTLLMSTNGLFLMFAGIHMRDAFLLFFCVLSVIAFHPRDGDIKLSGYFAKVPLLLLLCLLSFFCRTESFIIPVIAFCISACFALKTSRPATKLSLLLLLLLAIGGLLTLDIVSLVIDNYEQYQMLSSDENQGDSLAYSLIYELPFPISTILSSILLLFVKFPFWKSMFFDSYSLYVALGALQMLFVAPQFICVATASLLNFGGTARRYIYLLAMIGAVLAMTAITSNQVRHFAIVYPFLFMLCVERDQLIPLRQQWIYRLIQYGLCSGAFLVSAMVSLRA